MALNGLIAPVDGIFLPGSGPFATRFNCASGYLALDERSFIASEGKVVILHYDDHFGNLGKTEREFWTRIVFIPTAALVADSKGKIPANTVCEAFLKGKSRTVFQQAAVIATQKFKKGLAQLICEFKSVAEKNEKGNYASFAFEFSEPEKSDSAFMGEVLAFAQSVDPDAVQSFKAPGLIPLDSIPSDELALLKSHHASAVTSEPMTALPALNAA